MGLWPVGACNRVAAEKSWTEVSDAFSRRIRDPSADTHSLPIRTAPRPLNNLPNGCPMCRRHEKRASPVTVASTTLVRNLRRPSDAVLGGATQGEVIAVGTIGLFGSCIEARNSGSFQVVRKPVTTTRLSDHDSKRVPDMRREVDIEAAANGCVEREATARGARARAATSHCRVKRPTAT